jgi:hypothetical protein
MRYHQVINALEAVYANSGLIICGLALIQPQIKDGKLLLPFPISQGEWSAQPYRISFTESALRRSQSNEFRNWLFSQASETQQNIEEHVGQPPSKA